MYITGFPILAQEQAMNARNPIIGVDVRDY